MLPKTLGSELARIRGLRGSSLKTVSDAAEMSPTYLQRLERDEITSPSPNKLYALAAALGVPYAELMKLAGYVVPSGQSQASVPLSRGPLAHALYSEDLTDEEVAALTEYLAFHRSRKRSGGD